jgi:hypothetical protein
MDEQQGPPGRKLFSRDEINWRGILIAILVVVLTIIAIILITNLSDLTAEIAGHISDLFGRATINPNDPRGFAAFMQLVFIAIFAGWAINRFRRK